MNFQLVISLCNNSLGSTSQIVCVDIPSNFNTSQIRHSPVYSGFQGMNVSLTGMCQNEDKIFILLNGYPSKLAVFDKKTLSVVAVQELSEIYDGHSMITYGGSLYVVSTGTDEVISYNIRGDHLVNPQIFWKASSSGRDMNHINSIININGDFLISAFGPKSGLLNSSARKGFIYNITKDITIRDEIFHPHTLSERKGEIYFCESSRKSFRSLNENMIYLEGYTRGVSWITDEIVCIGTSIGRTISRSTGQILNSADPGDSYGDCKLSIFDTSTKKILRQIDLSRYGPEIYDILLVDNDIDLLKTASDAFIREREQLNRTNGFLLEKDQINQYLKVQITEKEENIQHLNAQISEKEENIQHLNAQISEKEKIIEHLKVQLENKEQEILFYSRSKSWRFTRPFRKIMKLVNRKRNG